MDQFGRVTKPYIGKGTINSKVYLKEYIQLRLVPSIEKCYIKPQVVFCLTLQSPIMLKMFWKQPQERKTMGQHYDDLRRDVRLVDPFLWMRRMAGLSGVSPGLYL